MPFLVLFVEAVRTRALVLRRPWAAAGLLTLAALLILTKRTNLYLVLACALVLLVLAAARARLPLAAGAALVVVLTGVVWPAAVLQPLGVKPGTGVDILTIPVQQTARTVLAHGDELAPEERDAIDAVLRYDGLAEAYDPRRSDRVKGRWNLEATREQKLAYARTWLAHLVRYPGTYLSATAANTYEYFAPLTPLSFQQELNLAVYVDYWLDRSVPGTTRAEVEAVALALDEPAALDDVRAAANEIQSALGEHAFVAAKALYSSWIPLLALAIALRRRDALLAAATIPLFVNLAFLVASPVALPRYTIPLIYGAVLVVGLMLTPVRRLRAVPRRRRRDAPASQASAL
jgi:predicted neutral ceramidase superfamily lipid hydrolase